MSEYRDLRSMNLNLLPVLRELLRHISVTEAARSLHLSQSSVSGSLKLLRDHFDDELLTTVGRRTVLTSFAKELVQPVERALEAAQKALHHRAFDPEKAAVRFVVVAADFVGMVLSPGFARLLQDRYPGISIQFVQGSAETLYSQLQDGQIDLVVSPTAVTNRLLQHLRQSTDHLARQRLWAEGNVGIIREGLPVPSTLDDYLSRPHVTVRFSHASSGSFEESSLDRMDRSRNDRVFVPNFLLLPFSVACSDCVACVPESLARFVATQLPITTFPLPLELPNMDIEMVWMPRDSSSPRHQWLRDAVRQCVDESRIASE